MSNYWKLYCETCGEYSETSINHGDHILRSIAKLASRFSELIQADDSGYLEISVMGYGGELISFASEHAEHELKLADEYGKFEPLTSQSPPQQESNICPICGGVKRVDYAISLVDGVPYNMRIYANGLETAWRLCPGHPEPAPKHDGRLTIDPDRLDHHAYIVEWRETNWGDSRIVAIDDVGSSSPHFALWPDEALRLLDWLIQETPTLERMAKEQEQ